MERGNSTIGFAFMFISDKYVKLGMPFLQKMLNNLIIVLKQHWSKTIGISFYCKAFSHLKYFEKKEKSLISWERYSI